MQPGFQSADHHDRFAVDQLGVAEELVQFAFDDPVGHGFEHIGLPVLHVSDAHVREFQLSDARSDVLDGVGVGAPAIDLKEQIAGFEPEGLLRESGRDGEEQQDEQDFFHGLHRRIVFER